MKRLLVITLLLLSLASCSKIGRFMREEDDDEEGCRKVNEHLIAVIHEYRQREKDRVNNFPWPDMDQGLDEFRKDIPRIYPD